MSRVLCCGHHQLTALYSSYGERGHFVIFGALCKLFNLKTYPNTTFFPLTPVQFFQYVLLPETAVLLIMEDMLQTREEAIRTMRESASYGVAMFPDDGAQEHPVHAEIEDSRKKSDRGMCCCSKQDPDPECHELTIPSRFPSFWAPCDMGCERRCVCKDSLCRWRL